MFKGDPVLRKSFLQYVPRTGDISDAFFAEAAGQLIQALKHAECMLTASGGWRQPKEVLVADEEFRALFPNEEIERILGVEYLSPEVQAPSETLKRLGVSHADVYGHLLALLEKSDQLATRSVDWWRALYQYCDKQITSDRAIRKFRSLAAIKLGDGNLARLSTTQVYFPLLRSRRFGFEHELVLLDPGVISKGKWSEAVVSFLGRVGVRKTEPYQLIVGHILPRHATFGQPPTTQAALIGHAAYIKHYIVDYISGATAEGESEAQALAKIGESLRLRCKKEDEEMSYWAIAREMYLGDEYRPGVALERMLGASGDPRKFVAGVYLARAAEDRDEEDSAKLRRAWRAFFYRIGVREYPAVEDVGGAGADFRAGPELTALLRSDVATVRKAAIEMLDAHWEHYAQYRDAQTTGRYGHVTRSESQLLLLIRSVKAPSEAAGDWRIQDTYLDTAFVRAVFGPSVPYLAAEVSNAGFLDAVGVVHRVDAAACIKRLDQLRAMQRVSRKEIKLIYRALEGLFGTESVAIDAAFREGKRIYVHALRAWFRSDEVVWRSSGALLDKLYPPLEAAYKEHETFFCRCLQVARVPSEFALIEALKELDEFGESHAERKREAIAIYRRLDRALRNWQSQNPGVDPEWLAPLKRQAVFLDHAGRMVNVSNDMYVGDDPRLVEAFKVHEQISFIDVDPSHVPQVQDLLTQCGMPKLSTVAECRLTAVDGAVLDLDATDRIRQRRDYLMRVVYAKAHGAFDQASVDGLWRAMLSLEVGSVASLEIEAAIREWKVRIATDIYRQGQTIYLQADARGKYDKLAEELCRYVGVNPDEIAESVYRVLTATDEADLDEFFEVKSIPGIPNDELVDECQTEGGTEVAEWDSGAPDMDSELKTLGGEFRGSATSDPPAGASATSAGRVGPQSRVPPMARAEDSSGGSAPGEASAEGSRDQTMRLPRQARGSEPARRSSGRLLSYAEPASGSSQDAGGGIIDDARLEIAREAVAFVLEREREEGHEVVEMPLNNEGFDILRGPEAAEECIEVKGLSGPWGAEGVALTPAELRMAERKRGRYWLYIVEFATDPSRRSLHRIQDPFGMTDQFRFDSGWKGIAKEAVRLIEPARGRRITVEGVGVGTILEVNGAGALLRLSIRLDSGDDVARIFDPTKMTVSELE